MLDMNFGLVTAVMCILSSIWMLGRYLLVDDFVYIPGRKRHNWVSIKVLSRACYCSICEMMLVASNGKFCDCCGVCADSAKCINKVDSTLKCKEKVRSVVDANTPHVHLWVRGNLPIHCVCFVCQEDVDYHAEPGIYGYRCCWCQRATHTDCFARMESSDSCDFGQFKELICPPSSLLVSKSGASGKMKLTAIQAPAGVNNWKPLFVIANSKSGDSNSAEVISLFRGILHPMQVTELGSKGPKEALRLVSKASPNQCQILVAGGDGTVGWILNTIMELKIEPIPDVSILPIGTGNDLSRVLNWGAEPPAALLPSEILQKIISAKTIKLDRWLIEIVNVPRRIPLKWSPIREMFMYNYFSVGVDAQVALNFHRARQSQFYMFSSRVINKILYLCFGTQQVVQPDCVGLEQHVELYLDEQRVELPELQSIVCLNIDSWGAGVRLWKMSTHSDEEYSHSTSDGVLEVLGIVSSFHIAQLQVGLSKPIRLGQAKSVKLIIKQKCPVQADGEPWIQSPAEITLNSQGQANMLQANSSAL